MTKCEVRGCDNEARFYYRNIKICSLTKHLEHLKEGDSEGESDSDE